MSYRMAVVSGVAIAFSFLLFTSIPGNNCNTANKLSAQVLSSSGPLPVAYYVPAGSREVWRQSTVESVLSRCERICDSKYKASVIKDLSRICKDTCHDIWDFGSRDNI